MDAASRRTIFLLLSTIAAAIVQINGVQTPVGSVLLLAYLLYCPGFMTVRLLGRFDSFAGIVLAVAVSICMSAIVATIMIYLGWWNPRAGTWVLIVMTLAGTLLPGRATDLPAAWAPLKPISRTSRGAD